MSAWEMSPNQPRTGVMPQTIKSAPQYTKTAPLPFPYTSIEKLTLIIICDYEK